MTYPRGFIVPCGADTLGGTFGSTRSCQLDLHSRSVGPRFRSPRSEKRSAASGIRTVSAASRADLFIAPRLGPTSMSTISAPTVLAAWLTIRWNAVVVRTAARSVPVKPRGQASESLSSKELNSRSPGTSHRPSSISTGSYKRTSPKPSMMGCTALATVPGLVLK